jgi:hypothetical protein
MKKPQTGRLTPQFRREKGQTFAEYAMIVSPWSPLSWSALTFLHDQVAGTDTGDQRRAIAAAILPRRGPSRPVGGPILAVRQIPSDGESA